MRLALCLVFAAACAGCSGQYDITLGEQVTPAGQDATVVIRLQKSEVGEFTPAVADAPVWFRIENGPVRGAITDKGGYAAAIIPTPKEPGKYHVTVGVGDKDGMQDEVFSPMWVLDPYRPVVAVEFECLPTAGKSQEAAAALSKFAEEGNVLYFTQRPMKDRERIHKQLAAAGYPDGPVLTWQRGFVHGTGMGTIIEDRLVSSLPTLKLQFVRFVAGVADSQLAAAAFTRAGLKCIVVAPEKFAEHYPKDCTRRSWSEIAQKGL